MYKITKPLCSNAPWPPNGNFSYDYCSSWVKMQVPAYNWHYNIIPA